MKRSAIVVLILVAGVTAMIWSGVMAYRMRKSLNTPSSMRTASPQLRKFLNPSSAAQSGNQSNAAANDKDSPSEQGLPDLREKPAPAFTLKTVDGKTVTRYLTQDQLARYQEWFDNARRLKEIVAKLEIASLHAVEQSEAANTPTAGVSKPCASRRRPPGQ